jgi:uncharacterized membrane protein YdjX (TVP38/TMEM64 family)
VEAPKNRQDVIRWVVGIVGVTGLLLLLSRLPLGERLLHLIEVVRALGPAGMAPFALSYAVLSLLLVPATPFPLAAGFLYGPVAGFFVAWAGEVLGACFAYAAGRWFLRDRARKLIRRSPLLAALDGALEEQGWTLLFLVRLSPLFPFGPLNYSLGLSGVRPGHYLLATALGLAPMCLLLTYTGSTLPHLQAVLSGEEGLEGAWMYWFGLLATGVAVIAVTRATRQALAKRLAHPPSDLATGEAPLPDRAPGEGA